MNEIAISNLRRLACKCSSAFAPLNSPSASRVSVSLWPTSSRHRNTRFTSAGSGVGSGRILGDIVGPIGDESDWEAARDPNPDDLDK